MNASEQIDRLEFAIVLAHELSELSKQAYPVAKLASALIAAHRRLHRMAEDNCNGFHTEAESDAHDAKVERARNRVAKMLAPYGITAVFGGDPRGAVLKLTLPRTKRTNGGGNEGYQVPR